MHAKRKHIAIAVAVVMLASGLALAVPTIAHDLDPKSKASKHTKPIYVGLGIGDHIVLCVDDSTPGEVTVDNPENGNNILTQSLPEPMTHVCLGGAAHEIGETADLSSSRPAEPSVPDQWQVWITDWVQNTGTQQGGPGTPGLWDLTGNEELPIAGFTNLRLEIHQHDLPGKARSCAPHTWHTQVCVENPDADVVKVKQAAQFAVCGKGGTDSIEDYPFTSDVTSSEDDHYIVTKIVFVDGPIFYPFDCALSGSVWCDICETIRDIVNNSPVCTDLSVCLFPIPATAAACWAAGDAKRATAWSTEAKHQIGGQPIPGMGVLGTIGSNHDSIVNNEGCEENANTAVTTNGQGALPDVEIENFPVDTDSCHEVYSDPGCDDSDASPHPE